MKRVVITGPTGAIGIALINECIEKKIEVLAICRRGSNRCCKIPVSSYVNIIESSLSELAEFEYEGKFDAFYHFAWDGTFGKLRNDMYLQNRNIQYTLDAVQLAKKLGCKVFIGAGSQAEYGRFEGVLTPLTPVFPENGYGIAKLCAGQISRVLCKQLDIKHIWARVLSVYGPHDGENTMIMSTINKLLKGETPKLTKGEQKWDYLYSRDAAKAMLLLGINGQDGKVYCLGSGKNRPLYEYIYEIRDLINKNAELEFGAIPYNQNQVMHLCADISDLTLDTGFVPETEFKQGISEIIRHIRS